MATVDFRCCICNKFLARLDGTAVIKCPRCHNFNYANGNSFFIVSEPEEKGGLAGDRVKPAVIKPR